MAKITITRRPPGDRPPTTPAVKITKYIVNLAFWICVIQGCTGALW